MGRRKTRPGTCRLCGTNGDLTFEHVPPRSAFNDQLVLLQTMDDYLARLERERGKQHQGGAGAYTLCASCNNRTGKWYGAEYAHWARLCAERLANVPRAVSGILLHVSDVHPLRFLKQAITMIFSANGPKFQGIHPELVKFVLDRERRHLPQDYDVFLTLIRPPYGRSAGLSGIHNFETGQLTLVSEVAHPPIAITLTVGQREADMSGCVSHFGQSGYSDRADVWLCVGAGETFTPYPLDFRLRERVESERTD